MKPLSVLSRPALPPPFPVGWYVVAFSEELAPGGVLTRRLAGQDVVLFRTESGAVSAVDPYCPHLGAHLGHGGRVQGETLRCPMHGFCFDTAGQCTSTPYAKRAPPKAKLRARALREQSGLLMLFHDPLGAEPTWEVPALAMEGWTPLLWRCLSFRGHPQETSENSVDLGHFSEVHGYGTVTIGNESSEGAYFHTEIRAERPRGLVSSKGRMPIEIGVHVHGLGVSYVDVTIPSLKLTTRHFVLSSPVEKDRIELRVAASIRDDFQPRNIHPLLSLVPRRLFMALMKQMVLRNYVADVMQDVPFWSHKTFLDRPALAAGDGPIGRYRQWARQFYVDAPDAATESHAFARECDDA